MYDDGAMETFRSLDQGDVFYVQKIKSLVLILTPCIAAHFRI